MTKKAKITCMIITAIVFVLYVVFSFVFMPKEASIQPESTTVQSEAIEDDTKPLKAIKHVCNTDIPLSFEFQKVMQQACKKYNVPYAVALAVAETESSFDLNADNGNCKGLMQIHPINYPRLRETGIEPTEYDGNITAGVFLLGELLEKYADTHKALMAYNCGEAGAKELWNDGHVKSEYSVKVVSRSEKWQKIINNNAEVNSNE